MKEQEEELTRHIKALFEDVDDGLSEQGWAELRKKYPQAPSRKLPIWWLSGVAASILVVAGLFLFVQKTPQPIIKKTNITQAKPGTVPNTANDKTAASQKPAIEPNQAVATYRSGHENTNGSQSLLAARQNPTEKTAVNTVSPAIAIAAVNTDTAAKPIVSSAPIAVAAQPQQQVAANQPAIVSPPKQQAAANESAALAATEPPANKAKTPLSAKKTTEDFLNEQSKLLMASNSQKEEKGRELKNSFDVFTGTFVNYYANNAAKINAGFGVNANIKVAPSVTISFGAGLSQNRLSYGNNNREVPNTLMSDVSSTAMAYNVISSESKISDVKFNAQLLAIDIPITVKIYPGKKKNFYIATGINSNSYLLQRYTYDYTVQNTTGFVKSVPIQEQTEESKFKGFDFANSAIFAIGLSQSLGKNTIIFEPYFKPTIGSMGDKNLKINSAGINLRFNFAGKKK